MYVSSQIDITFLHVQIIVHINAYGVCMISDHWTSSRKIAAGDDLNGHGRMAMLVMHQIVGLGRSKPKRLRPQTLENFHEIHVVPGNMKIS